MNKWIYYRGKKPLLCLPINDHYLQQEEFWEILSSFVKYKEMQRQINEANTEHTDNYGQKDENKHRDSLEESSQNDIYGSHHSTENSRDFTSATMLTNISQAILVPIPLPNKTAQKNKQEKTTTNNLYKESEEKTETDIYQRIVSEIIGRIKYIPTKTALIFQTSGTTKAGGHLVGLSWEGIIGAIAAGTYINNPLSDIPQPKTNISNSELSKPKLTGTQTKQALQQLKQQEWILAIPGQHIGGFLVILRSLLAGKLPHRLPLAEGFSEQKLAALIHQIQTTNANKNTPKSIHISLVPTQIKRCLKNPEALLALKQVSQILVGGAPTNQNTQQEIKSARLNVTYTYGMTETSGGCIYDGQPLPGSTIRIESGRIYLICPGIMTGYLDEPPVTGLTQFPSTLENQTTKWLRTNDFGRIVNNNNERQKPVKSAAPEPSQLEVIGRIDRVAMSGGKKIPLDIVQKAIDELEQLKPQPDGFTLYKWAEQLVVTKIPDSDWGEIVAVAATPTKTKTENNLGEASLKNLKKIGETLRETLAKQLPKIYLPRAIVLIDRIPLLHNGKVDQITLEKQVAENTATSAWIYKSTTKK